MARILGERGRTFFGDKSVLSQQRRNSVNASGEHKEQKQMTDVKILLAVEDVPAQVRDDIDLSLLLFAGDGSFLDVVFWKNPKLKDPGRPDQNGGVVLSIKNLRLIIDLQALPEGVEMLVACVSCYKRQLTFAQLPAASVAVKAKKGNAPVDVDNLHLAEAGEATSAIAAVFLLDPKTLRWSSRLQVKACGGTTVEALREDAQGVAREVAETRKESGKSLAQMGFVDLEDLLESEDDDQDDDAEEEEDERDKNSEGENSKNSQEGEGEEEQSQPTDDVKRKTETEKTEQDAPPQQQEEFRIPSKNVPSSPSQTDTEGSDIPPVPPIPLGGISAYSPAVSARGSEKASEGSAGSKSSRHTGGQDEALIPAQPMRAVTAEEEDKNTEAEAQVTSEVAPESDSAAGGGKLFQEDPSTASAQKAAAAAVALSSQKALLAVHQISTVPIDEKEDGIPTPPPNENPPDDLPTEDQAENATSTQQDEERMEAVHEEEEKTRLSSLEERSAPPLTAQAPTGPPLSSPENQNGETVSETEQSQGQVDHTLVSAPSQEMPTSARRQPTSPRPTAPPQTPPPGPPPTKPPSFSTPREIENPPYKQSSDAQYKQETADEKESLLEDPSSPPLAAVNTGGVPIEQTEGKRASSAVPHGQESLSVSPKTEKKEAADAQTQPEAHNREVEAFQKKLEGLQRRADDAFEAAAAQAAFLQAEKEKTAELAADADRRLAEQKRQAEERLREGERREEEARLQAEERLREAELRVERSRKAAEERVVEAEKREERVRLQLLAAQKEIERLQKREKETTASLTAAQKEKENKNSFRSVGTETDPEKAEDRELSKQAADQEKEKERNDQLLTIAELQERVKSLEKEKGEGEERVKGLEKEKEEGEGRVKILEKENEEGKERVTTLEKEKGEGEGRVKVLEKEKEESLERIQTLQKEKQEGEERIEAMQREKEENGAKLKSLQNAQTQQEEEAGHRASAVVKEAETLKAQTETLKQVLDQQKREKEELQGALRDAEEKFFRAQAAWREEKGDLESRKNRFVEELRGQLSRAVAEADDLLERLRRREKKEKEMEDDITLSIQKIEEVTLQRNEEARKNAQLSEALQETEAKLQTLLKEKTEKEEKTSEQTEEQKPQPIKIPPTVAVDEQTPGSTVASPSQPADLTLSPPSPQPPSAVSPTFNMPNEKFPETSSSSFSQPARTPSPSARTARSREDPKDAKAAARTRKASPSPKASRVDEKAAGKPVQDLAGAKAESAGGPLKAQTKETREKERARDSEKLCVFALKLLVNVEKTVLKISSLSIRWTALRAPTALGVALPPGAGYESEYVQRGHSPMRREVAKAPAETPHLQIRALIRDARQELLRVKEYHTVCAALKGRLRLSMPSKSPLPTVAARKTSGGSTQTVDQGDREETDRTLKEVDKKIRECEAALLDLLIRIQNEADLRAGGFSPRRQPSPSPPPQKSNNNLEATQTDNPGPYFDLSVSPPRKIKQASPQKPNLPSPSRRSNSPVMRNMRVLFDGSFAGL